MVVAEAGSCRDDVRRATVPRSLPHAVPARGSWPRPVIEVFAKEVPFGVQPQLVRVDVADRDRLRAAGPDHPDVPRVAVVDRAIPVEHDGDGGMRRGGRANRDEHRDDEEQPVDVEAWSNLRVRPMVVGSFTATIAERGADDGPVSRRRHRPYRAGQLRTRPRRRLEGRRTGRDRRRRRRGREGAGRGRQARGCAQGLRRLPRNARQGAAANRQRRATLARLHRDMVVACAEDRRSVHGKADVPHAGRGGRDDRGLRDAPRQAGHRPSDTLQPAPGAASRN